MKRGVCGALLVLSLGFASLRGQEKVNKDEKKPPTANERMEALFKSSAAKQQEIKRRLPEWLAPYSSRGLVASLDDDDQVASISVGAILSDELLSKFKTLPRLRELHTGGGNLTPLGLKQLAELTSLQKITLYGLRHDGQGLGDTALANIVGLKSLVEIHVFECGTTDAGVKLLETMPQLTHLTLHQEAHLTDKAVYLIARLKGLKYLDLAYFGSSDEAWMRFSRESLKSLAALRDLEALYVHGQDIPAEPMRFTQLKSLSLGHSGVSDTWAAKIAECRELRFLELTYTKITDDGLKNIAKLPDLQHFNLSSYVVTDAGIGHLERLPALGHLSLRASRLTDQSLKHLTHMKKLNRIDLHGSGYPGHVVGSCFTIDGIRQLKELPNLQDLYLTNLESANGFAGLKELTQLRSLTLQSANISFEDFDVMEKALPNTYISAVNGHGSLRNLRKR